MPSIPQNIPLALKSLQIGVNPLDLVALKVDAQVEMPKDVDTRSSCFSLMFDHQAHLFSFSVWIYSLKMIADGTNHV